MKQTNYKVIVATKEHIRVEDEETRGCEVTNFEESRNTTRAANDYFFSLKFY